MLCDLFRTHRCELCASLSDTKSKEAAASCLQSFIGQTSSRVGTTPARPQNPLEFIKTIYSCTLVFEQSAKYSSNSKVYAVVKSSCSLTEACNCYCWTGCG